jgi:hypothetical protein
MNQRVDHTIAQLIADARPVRRFGSPMRRSLAWLAAVLVLFALLVWGAGAGPVLAAEFQSATHAIEFLAALATGALALVAAFHLAMPDRAPRWVWLPIPTLALWVGTTLFACVEGSADASFRGFGWHCFVFIVVVSLPLGVALVFALRRGAPLAPVRAGLVGGLAVASLAGALLHAFHPFDGGMGDTGMHAVAVVAVVSAFAALARSALDRL